MICCSIEKLAIIGVASLAIVAQAAPAAEHNAVVERGVDSLPDYESQLYARKFDDAWWNGDAESSVRDKRDILDERSPQRQAPGPEPGEGNSRASQPKTGGSYRPGSSRPSNSQPGNSEPSNERPGRGEGAFSGGRPNNSRPSNSEPGSGRPGQGRGGFNNGRPNGRPSDFGGGRGGRGGFGGRPSSGRPDQGRGGFNNGRPSDFGGGRGGRGGFGRRPPSSGRRGRFSP